MNKLVNKFARFLSENGVKKGDIVGVCMDKNNLFIVSILAVLKLGAAYLPIHPDYPEDRISYILSDSNSKLLICDLKNESEIYQDNSKLYSHQKELLNRYRQSHN